MQNPPFCLNNIPEKKIHEAKSQIMAECDTCKNKEKFRFDSACESCRIKNMVLERYAKANIPVKYWFIKLDQQSFEGPKQLWDHYILLTTDISTTYKQGKSLMFAGNFGIGTTTVCTGILRKALEKGYTAQYLTLNDIVSSFVTHTTEDKAAMRNYILKVDFLVIDEFDPRHIGSASAADLFGRILEDIVRIRAQNNLPMFFCSNSIDAKSAFNGEIKRSLDSLWNYVKEVPLLGKDLRKEGK